MGLKIKILSGFIILALMLALAGAWSVYELKATGSSVQALLDENIRSIHAASKMNDALEREDSAVLLLLLGHWEQGRTQLTNADKLFNAELSFAYSNVTIPGEKTLLDSISRKYSIYKSLWEKPIVDTKREGNIEWYFNSVHLAFQDVKISIRALNNLNNETMYKTASSLKDRSNRAVMPGLIAIISALVFTLIFNYFVNYYMVSPIIRMTERVRLFILKHTPYNVQIDSDDEIAHLSESIGQLCEFVSVREIRK